MSRKSKKQVFGSIFAVKMKSLFPEGNSFCLLIIYFYAVFNPYLQRQEYLKLLLMKQTGQQQKE